METIAEMKTRMNAAEKARKQTQIQAKLAREIAQAGLMQSVEDKYRLPSVEALARAETRIARSIRCCRCGSSSLDGAMFTTIAGGNICDDCIG